MASDGQVRLTWDASSGATGYNLYYEVNNRVGTSSPTTANVTSPFTLTGLTDSVTYYFTVTAVGPGGESAGSALATATPQAVDLTPPAVAYTSPNDQALGALASTVIEVGFSEELDPASATTANISVSGASSGLVSGSVSYAARVLHFTPGAALASGDTFTVTLTTGLADAAGNALASPYSFSFSTTPAGPATLSAQRGKTSISLGWAAVPGARGYVIYRGNASGGPYTRLTGITAVGYTDTGLSNGTTYYYVVTAYTALGETLNSPEASGTPDSTNSPNTVANVVAKAGNGEVSVTWDYTASGERFALLRATSPGGPYTSVATLLNQINFHDSGLTNGTTYYYVVQSTNLGGVGSYSTEVSATPRADLLASPANLTATAYSRVVSLSWSPVTGAAGYQVYSSSDPHTHYSLAGGDTVTSFTDGSVANGSTYRYVVCAVDAQGRRGGCTDEVTASPTTSLAPPTTTLARAYAFANGDNRLEWTPVPNANFSILRATASGGPYTSLPTVSGSSYDDTSAVPGTVYYYVVQPTNGTTNAARSNELSVTSSSAPITTPTNVAALAGNGCVTLTWDPVAGASRYYIYLANSSGGASTSYNYVSDPMDNHYTWCGFANDTANYYFRVTAYFGPTQESAPSSPDVSAMPSAFGPSAPGSFALYTGNPGDGELTVKWAVVANTTGYQLYRRDVHHPWALLTTLTAQTATMYQDTGLTNGETYGYAVRAQSAVGPSQWSSALYATPAANRPPAPTNVVAQGGNGCITVRWDVVPSASRYYLYRTDASGKGNLDYNYVSDTFDNHYTWCGFGNVTDYFRVDAYSPASGEGNLSGEVSATTSDLLPAAPSASLYTGNSGNQDAAVRWSGVANVSSYRVWRRSDTEGWVQVADQPNTTYLDTGLDAARSYAYAAQPRSAGGDGAWGSPAGATPSLQLPPTPTHVVAVPGEGCITVTWDPVAGASRYYIYRALAPGNSSQDYNYTSDGFDTHYTWCGFPDGTPEYFRVTAKYPTTNEGQPSAEVSATQLASLPTAPGGLGTVTNYAADREVDLSWNPVTNATGYQLYRRTPVTSWVPVPGALGSAPTFRDRGLTDGTNYSWAVQALYGSTPGPWSGVASYTPAATQPGAPGSPVAAGGNGCVTLNWAPVPGASRYYVYRGTSPGGPYSSYNYTSDGQDTHYTWCGFTNGAPEYFVITAHNSTGEGALSDEVTATPSAQQASAPNAPQVSPGAAGVLSLTWNDTAPAYRVFRLDPGAGWTQVGEVTSPQFTDTGLVSGTGYGYAVQEMTVVGPGTWSNPAGAAAP